MKSPHCREPIRSDQIMGKSKKSRRVAMFRSDPIKAETSNGGVEGNKGIEGQIVNSSVIETVEAQLSSGQSLVTAPSPH